MKTAQAAIISILTMALAMFLAMQASAWLARKRREEASKRLADAAVATQQGAAADEVANNE